MAEFGEKLKKVREEKGLTQQTLADYLFVTRQAVSRWEGGSRYPDLMTAKKLSQYLDVSLDELLSDDDMKQYAEKNAILDSPVTKHIQVALLSLAFMCSLILSVIYLNNYLIQGNYVISSVSETIKNVLLTIVLGYGIYVAIRERLNAKMATSIAILYMGTAIISGLVRDIWNVSGSGRAVILSMTALNIVFLVVCLQFFSNQKSVNPIFIYVLSGIYGVIGAISFVVGFLNDVPTEIYRELVILSVCSLIEGILLLLLLVFMAYILTKKRRLAMR